MCTILQHFLEFIKVITKETFNKFQTYKRLFANAFAYLEKPA